MEQQLIDIFISLRISLRNLTVVTFVVAGGLFAFMVYGFVTMSRIQQGMWLQLRRQYSDIDRDLQEIKGLLHGR